MSRQATVNPNYVSPSGPVRRRKRSNSTGGKIGKRKVSSSYEPRGLDARSPERNLWPDESPKNTRRRTPRRPRSVATQRCGPRSPARRPLTPGCDYGFDTARVLRECARLPDPSTKILARRRKEIRNWFDYAGNSVERYRENLMKAKEVHKDDRKQLNNLRNKLRRATEESKRKDRHIEDLLEQHKDVVTQDSRYYKVLRTERVVNKALQAKVVTLEGQLRTLASELADVKHSLKYTTAQDLKGEMVAYYNESERCRGLVLKYQGRLDNIAGCNEDWHEIVERLTQDKEKWASTAERLREIVEQERERNGDYQSQVDRLRAQLEHTKDQGWDQGKQLQELARKVKSFEASVPLDRAAHDQEVRALTEQLEEQTLVADHGRKFAAFLGSAGLGVAERTAGLVKEVEAAWAACATGQEVGAVLPRFVMGLEKLPPASGSASSREPQRSTTLGSAPDDSSEEARAATRIQATFRGNQCRRQAAAAKQERAEQAEAATRIQATFRGNRDRKQAAEAKQERAEQAEAATRIQATFRGNQARKQAARGQHSLTAGKAATPAVQAALRCAHARQSYRRANAAATKIQAAIRGKQTRDAVTEIKAELDVHATKIQSAFRGHRERRKLQSSPSQQQPLSLVSTQLPTAGQPLSLPSTEATTARQLTARGQPLSQLSTEVPTGIATPRL